MNLFVSRAPACAAFTLFASLLSTAARAATVSWLPDVSGSWTSPANWSSNPALPGPADDVFISQPDPITVTFNAAGSPTLQSANSLTCNNSLFLQSGVFSFPTLQLNGALTLSSATLQDTAISASPTAAIAFNQGTDTLSNVTLAGAVTQSAFVVLLGNVTNNANWTQVSNNTAISLQSNTILNGNGTINLAGQLINGPDCSLTIAPTQTIQGSGTIAGGPGQLTLNNNGLIQSNSFTPLVITLGNLTSTNTGAIQSVTGGNLTLTGTYYTTKLDNTGGTIAAGNPVPHVTLSRLNINNVLISGGQLVTQTDGLIAFQSGAGLSNASASGRLHFSGTTYLSNVTLNGTVAQDAGSAINLTGNITNNANWFQNVSSASISLQDNTSIDGTGSITLLQSTFTSGGNFSLTLGPTQTLQGSGRISTATLINNGSIAANQAANLTIDATLTNNGSLSVSNGANLTLLVSPTNILDGGLRKGTWYVGANSTLSLPANLSTNSANLTLDGQNSNLYNLLTGENDVLANLAKNTGTLTITNGRAFATASSLFNTGTLVVGSNASLSAPQLVLSAGLLAGSGTISAPVACGNYHHIIHPGLPGSTTSATLTLSSLSTSPTTTLAFNLAAPATGNTSSSNDQLLITSPAGLSLNGGAIAITSAPAGPAALGYYQLLAYSSSFTGSLAALTLPAPPAPNFLYTLDTTRDPGFIDLHLGLLGDANDDAKIDLTDLSTVLNHFGQSTLSWSNGNFDGQPTVNLTDLSYVLNNFGLSIPAPTVHPLPAPEPASASLLLAAAPLLLRRRKTTCI